ncbi:YeiH family protein [Methylovirgula sp. 4M-Z18]|uniref:YeiH family protein n=1 Tax=Methylovirgula sp. 4M-Z18 TaxID=2293567 RepID=UPI000E2E5BD4|nr:putative sulfate exporter family transporter [Methylovirgula sp. 4M-Z18]RFB79647.1 putative sulfate exporter family transporter [Methylovirgula sp. 4M-Z18]
MAHIALSPPAAGRFPIRKYVPGILLCIAVTFAAIGLQRVEAYVFGHDWLEALVLAILLGTAIRTLWTPHARFQPGITFSAKILLEVAVVLLGASISFSTLLAVGPALIIGIALVVVLAIGASYLIGRLLGLHHKLALLVACGNSICGNSAIAVVAPVIDADSGDVASSIAFTAVLGVAVVLGLPLLVPVLHMSATQYGTLAGLTVYAVPQVLAATVPVGALSNQVGTLIKLVRVLMLGPVVLMLSLFGHRLGGGSASAKRVSVHHLVPWFIVGFLAMAALRSCGAIPAGLAAPVTTLASLLTVVSMAALGLGVDVRMVARAGVRVTSAVILSLLVLGAISLALIYGLHVA